MGRDPKRIQVTEKEEGGGYRESTEVDLSKQKNPPKRSPTKREQRGLDYGLQPVLGGMTSSLVQY